MLVFLFLKSVINEVLTLSHVFCLFFFSAWNIFQELLIFFKKIHFVPSTVPSSFMLWVLDAGETADYHKYQPTQMYEMHSYNTVPQITVLEGRELLVFHPPFT